MRTVSLCVFFGLVLGVAGGFLVGRYTSVLGPDQPPPPAVAQPAAGATAPAVLGQPAAPTEPPKEDGPPPLPEDVRRLDTKISGSLYATLAKNLEGRQADILNAQLGRILVWWFEPRRDVLKSDRLQLLYKPPDNPTVLNVMAVHYTSEKNRRTYKAYLYRPEDSRYGHFYTEKGEAVEEYLVNPPIEEYEQITELMNLTGRRHRGVDFKVDMDTPVRAPWKAKVLRRNWNTRRNGYCLEIKYVETGTRAFFLHLNEVLPETKPGKVVAAGTEIARTGNSGRSTAPHLHYELRTNSGKTLNPFKVHETRRAKLEGEDLTAFTAHRDKLDSWLLRQEPADESAPSPSGSTPSKASAK
jgi:murein DD-endopeptidase MepM/ murein hydrolase activator NlpD